MERTSHLLIKEGVEAFIAGIRGIRSPATVQWYGYMLASLVNDFGECEIKSVTLDHLRLWRARLFERELSVWSIRDYVRAIQTYFKWEVAEKRIRKSPAERLEMPKAPRRPRLGIALEDKNKLIQAARQSSPRDLALVLLITSSLCRRGGAARLVWSDIDWDHRRALVTEKGDKTREIYLSSAAIDALKAWREIAPKDRDLVFGLLPNSIYEVFRKLAKSVSIEHANPHSCRHGGARQMIRNGANLTEVQQILGHESITTTAQFYGTLDNDELQDAHDKYLGK